MQLKEHLSIAGAQTNTLYTYTNPHLNYNNFSTPVPDTIKSILEGKRSFDAINAYTFISVPLSFQYNLIHNHTSSLQLVGGVNVNVLSKYENFINPNAKAVLLNESEKNADKTNIGIAIYTGLKMERTINKTLSLFALPFFSYNPVQQKIKNTTVNTKIHLAGVSLGISYKFK